MMLYYNQERGDEEMTKDYFKRLTTNDLTSWDLNCRHVVYHTPSRNKLEKRFRRKARRIAKFLLRREMQKGE